jgi:ferredoxin
MSNELPYRIEIDRSVCMGSGVCVVYAAETFDIDDETKSVVRNPAGNPQEQIEAAVAGCPTGALTFVRLTEDEKAI